VKSRHRVADGTIKAAVIDLKSHWAKFHSYGPQPEVEPLDASDVAQILDIGVDAQRVRKVLDQLVLSGDLTAIPFVPHPALAHFSRESRSTYVPATTRHEKEAVA
jgi:hypothetical protein